MSLLDSQKPVVIPDYWTPDEAHLILSFLDDIKDAIWNHYGVSIVEQHQREHNCEDNQSVLDFDFDDPI